MKKLKTFENFINESASQINSRAYDKVLEYIKNNPNHKKINTGHYQAHEIVFGKESFNDIYIFCNGPVVTTHGLSVIEFVPNDGTSGITGQEGQELIKKMKESNFDSHALEIITNWINGENVHKEDWR
jgi:hypothetical protein